MNKLELPILEFQDVLLIDFDGTLFNTSLLKETITVQLKKYTQDTNLLWQTEKKLRDQESHLAQTISEFCQKAGITNAQDEVQNIFLTQRFPQFVYPEVFEALAALSHKATLCIFSQGDEVFQQVKVHQSGLSAYFQYFFIFQKKLPELKKIKTQFHGKTLWLIDNKVSVLKAAVSLVPELKTVHVVREEYEIDQSFQPTHRIKSLVDLDRLVFLPA